MSFYCMYNLKNQYLLLQPQNMKRDEKKHCMCLERVQTQLPFSCSLPSVLGYSKIHSIKYLFTKSSISLIVVQGGSLVLRK